MKSPVMIKGNKFGIVLVLDKELPFKELLKEIEKKFQESAKFFDPKLQMAICFEGRLLTTAEQREILECIEQCCDLKISYILDKDETVEKMFEAKVKSMEQEKEEPEVEVEQVEQESIKEENSETTLESNPTFEPQLTGKDYGQFYRGTLRSGQSIEFNGNIVVIGDVNPGAKITATGNIIVIGSLKGTAYAGVDGDNSAFILALHMSPMQVRIGDLYARCPDKKPLLKRKKKQNEQSVQIAFVDNGNIYIEPISKSVLGDVI